MPASTPDDMQNRIDRLEGLVLSLMTNGASAPGPAAAVAAISSRSQSDSVGSLQVDGEDDDMIKEEDEEDSEVEGVANSLGVLKVDADKGKSMYLGDSHWHLVLQDVSLFSGYFSSEGLFSLEYHFHLKTPFWSLLISFLSETWLIFYHRSPKSRIISYHIRKSWKRTTRGS